MDTCGPSFPFFLLRVSCPLTSCIRLFPFSEILPESVSSHMQILLWPRALGDRWMTIHNWDSELGLGTSEGTLSMSIRKGVKHNGQEKGAWCQTAMVQVWVLQVTSNWPWSNDWISHWFRFVYMYNKIIILSFMGLLWRWNEWIYVRHLEQYFDHGINMFELLL